MTFFEDAIRTLDQMGVADVLLPFFLVFVLVYAILQKTKILGTEKDTEKPKSKFNVIVAFVSGMMVVFTHILYGNTAYDVVPIINNALPILLLALVGVLALGLLVGLFSGKSMKDWDGAKNYFFIASIIFVVWTFLAVSDFVAVPYFLRNIIHNQSLVNTIIAVVVFLAIIGYITKAPKTADEKASKPAFGVKLFGK